MVVSEIRLPVPSIRTPVPQPSRRMDGGVLAGVRLDTCGTAVRVCGTSNLISDTTIAGCDRVGIDIMPGAQLRLVTSELADVGTGIDVGAGDLDACEIMVTGATDGLRLGAGTAALFRARIRQCRRAGVFVEGRRATLRCNASPWEPGLTLSDNGTDILDARGPDAPRLLLAGVVHA